MRIATVMTPNVKCATPEMTLQTAGRLMAQHDIGSLPVVQRDEAVGIVTDRDIVVRAIGAGLDPSETCVEQVMSHDVASCRPEDDVDDAATVMEQRRIRRLLVVDDDGCLCGIVSLGDLAVRNDEPETAEEVLEYVSWPGHRQEPLYSGGGRTPNGRRDIRRSMLHEARPWNGSHGSLTSMLLPGLIGFATGAATMYIVDPARGARRRALVRDKLIHATHVAQRALGRTARHTGNRARGLAAATWNRFRSDDSDATVLEERVRSALGRAVSHPHSIEVHADDDGDVILRGLVLEHELEALLDAVQRVRGVRAVRSMLDVRWSRGNEPALQGGRVQYR